MPLIARTPLVKAGLAGMAIAALAACNTNPATEASDLASAESPAAQPVTPASTSSADDERTDGKSDLELQVTVEQVEGELFISLVDEAGWNGEARPVAGLEEAVTGSPVVIMIDGLTPGTYAIKAFHDLNGNDEMDTNIMGIPSEPYAFSNDAAGNFGPPEFEAAAFEVSAGTTVHKMSIK